MARRGSNTKTAIPAEAASESPWAPFEHRRSARSLKRDAVLRMSVRMFVKHGYHRTKLVDIANNLNITKTALYNYFDSKEAILTECFDVGFREFDEDLANINKEGRNGLELLCETMRVHIVRVVDDFGMCVSLLDPREFGEEQREAVRAKHRSYDKMYRELIEKGMADGSIRNCDVKLTAYFIEGAIKSTTDWFDKKGERSVDEIADTFVGLLRNALAA